MWALFKGSGSEKIQVSGFNLHQPFKMGDKWRVLVTISVNTWRFIENVRRCGAIEVLYVYRNNCRNGEYIREGKEDDKKKKRMKTSTRMIFVSNGVVCKRGDMK